MLILLEFFSNALLYAYVATTCYFLELMESFITGTTGSEEQLGNLQLGSLQGPLDKLLSIIADDSLTFDAVKGVS